MIFAREVQITVPDSAFALIAAGTVLVVVCVSAWLLLRRTGK